MLAAPRAPYHAVSEKKSHLLDLRDPHVGVYRIATGAIASPAVRKLRGMPTLPKAERDGASAKSADCESTR